MDGVRWMAFAVWIVASAACGDPSPAPRSPDAPGPAAVADDVDPLWGLLPGPRPAPPGPAVLVGAGDIARCYDPADPLAVTPPSQTAAEATAKLLDETPGTVIAVGDNAYELGSPADYRTCYDPTWGRHEGRTRPATGNHEYLTPGALGYFLYFGWISAPPFGYYSYDLGSWHVVVLNSTTQWALCPPREISSTAPGPLTPAEGRSCVGDVVQRAWLAADLDAHPRRCTAAYFHHPRFSSGRHGSQYEMQQFWDLLYARGVDLVISAHDHLYERFAPQDPDGNLDLEHGIRQFTVGTGGAELYEFRTTLPNSEVRDDATHGVLRVTLNDGSFDWAFLPVDGATFTDSGHGDCHGAPPPR